jgi:hypothetical protein
LDRRTGYARQVDSGILNRITAEYRKGGRENIGWKMADY